MVNAERCTGCCACSAACPVGAITMRRDSIGFLCPQVDEALCTHCGACDCACPADQLVPGTENTFYGLKALPKALLFIQEIARAGGAAFCDMELLLKKYGG